MNWLHTLNIQPELFQSLHNSHEMKYIIRKMPKSAIDGKWVTAAAARRNPKTTVLLTVKFKKRA